MPLEKLLELPGFTLDQVECPTKQSLIISATSQSKKARCPSCKTESGHQHSTYVRMPKGLPWGENSVRFRLKVNRFFCHNPNCPKVTFAEQLPLIVLPHAQRTLSAIDVLRAIAFETSAESVSRISGHLNMETSSDTILRILRSTRQPERLAPRVLGVDDWAIRRGQNYGTILVDLETHEPVDLLLGRSAETLKEWLKSNPGVQIISRDRSKEYKAAVDEVLPDAIQIVDRWHLYHNLRERLERILANRSSQNKDQANKSTSKRQGRFEYVRYLHAKGYSTRTIARVLEMSRGTVIKYIETDHLPDWKTRKPTQSELDRFDPYLRKRWREGCRDTTQLWEELKELGYAGGRKQLHRYLRRYHEKWKPSPRQVAWLYMKSLEYLEDEECDFLAELFEQNSALKKIYNLSQGFIKMLSKQEAKQFDRWLIDAERCGIKIFENFAAGIRADCDAVKNALVYSWSNGQTEGQVTRLKLIKRQMYGRANFDLLRIRVLGPP
jgi:transposase